MDIKEKDKELIIQLCERKITIDEFKSRTSFKATKNQLYILLKETEDKCNQYNENTYFDAIFWKLPCEISKDEKKEIYGEFILKPYHHEHEEIAGAFQAFFHDDKENIAILLNAIKQIPEYLQPEDFKYPYIRKIIYAIGAQPEPYNIQALEELAKSADEQIRELALHQIEKRKKLGNWESKKKTE
jgi:hypothetical protein